MWGNVHHSHLGISFAEVLATAIAAYAVRLRGVAGSVLERRQRVSRVGVKSAGIVRVVWHQAGVQGNGNGCSDHSDCWPEEGVGLEALQTTLW